MADKENQPWTLHLRRARGEALTTEEQNQLDAWYAEQDQAETASLGLSSKLANPNPLKLQIDVILGRIAVTSQTIRDLAEDNEALRHENMALRKQLVEHALLQQV